MNSDQNKLSENITQSKNTSQTNTTTISYTTHISTSVGMPPAASGKHISTMLALTEKPRFYRGYMNGFKQPVGLVKLQVVSFHKPQIEILQQALKYYFNNTSVTPIHSEHDLAACLAENICALQKNVGFPVFEPMQVNATSGQNPIFSLWIPTLNEECFHHIIALMIKFFDYHLAARSWVADQRITTELKDFSTAIQTHAPVGSNSLRLLQAAQNEGIPWVHICHNIYQFGHGRHSRWFDSTFTENSSKISTQIARNKKSTNMLLRRAGLPVAEQRSVKSENEAVKVANEIGYPVVIKPQDLDGGLGVFAKLINDSQVRTAYKLTQQYSKAILIEKHITGKDYRLLVFNGELVWAIERVPAGVTGDGKSTIKELIEHENQRPERSKNKVFTLKTIDVTDDVISYLADQGYNLTSIPESGRFIPVNRIANISTGGTPVAIFDKVHPDNKWLAEYAANLLRLDVAGIDFITSDIEQSYKTTGSAILEVNGQPQLGIMTGPHLHKQFITTIVPNQGRIPLIVISNSTTDHAFIQQLTTHLSPHYKNIGSVSDKRAYLNDEMIGDSPSSFNAAESLLLNNKLDLLIYSINSCEDINFQGLPFYHYDYLFYLEAPKYKTGTDLQQENDLIDMLFKACRGSSFAVEDTWDDLMHRMKIESSNFMRVKDRASLIDQLLQRLKLPELSIT